MVSVLAGVPPAVNELIVVLDDGGTMCDCDLASLYEL
jgi:hypothetical protein